MQLHQHENDQEPRTIKSPLLLELDLTFYFFYYQEPLTSLLTFYDQEPGTIGSPRLLELDLSLNQISKVPQLQNLPALEWLSLEVFLDLEYETQNKVFTYIVLV